MLDGKKGVKNDQFLSVEHRTSAQIGWRGVTWCGGVTWRGWPGGAGWPGGLDPVGVAGPGQEGVDYPRGAFARAGDTVAAAVEEQGLARAGRP